MFVKRSYQLLHHRLVKLKHTTHCVDVEYTELAWFLFARVTDRIKTSKPVQMRIEASSDAVTNSCVVGMQQIEYTNAECALNCSMQVPSFAHKHTVLR